MTIISYRYRKAWFRNMLVLQRGVPVSTEAPEPGMGPRNASPTHWSDAQVHELANALIKSTSPPSGLNMRYWRLRAGWFGRLILQTSTLGSDYTWEDARVQDLSTSATPPLPGAQP